MPPLDCRWRDVVFLSCLSPLVIYRELAGPGRRWTQPPRWYAIGAEVVHRLPTTVFVPPPRLASEAARSHAFLPFNPDEAIEPRTLPPATRLHYRAAVKLGRRPFLFHRVPHVLARGAVDVSGAAIERFGPQAATRPAALSVRPPAAR